MVRAQIFAERCELELAVMRLVADAQGHESAHDTPNRGGVRSEDVGKGRDAAAALGAALRERARRGYRVLGPARAPLARLRQEHRFQILLKGGRKAMREAVRAALVARYGETRWPGVAVDVDPLTVL